MREKFLKGIPVSSGIGIGKVFLYKRDLPHVPERVINEDEILKEISRFRSVINKVEKELSDLYQKVREEMGSDIADLIEFQILLLKDEEILSRVEKFIQEKKWDGAFSYYRVIQDYRESLANSSLPFIRERETDIADCAYRVLRSLLGDEKTFLSNWHTTEDVILFAFDLTPTEVAILNKEKVRGIALGRGGKSGHVAIMAKAKEIPAVDGIWDLMRDEYQNRTAILDGKRGVVIINPNEKRIAQYQREIAEEKKMKSIYLMERESECVTRDGKYIDISANIEFIGEVEKAKEYGAKGIGLFRTEYLFFSRRRIPSEEEQLFFYEEVAKKMKPYPVIIRTFDLGGDKVIPGYTELNPFLGWRGIRIFLEKRELLRTQIRAIMRAGAEHKNLKIMFPMISTLEEVQEIKREISQVKAELEAKGIPFDPEVELGIMIETPSSALLAEKIAPLVSFFSIGSNDLTQYTLACARDNERVSYLYDPLHPTVIRLYKETIAAARKYGIWVGVCGEIASEVLGIVLLVGLGIDELSMVPAKIPEAKRIIRQLEWRKTQEWSEKALSLATAKGVRRFLIREIRKNLPDLAEGLNE
jgi:phosphotransferase system enzyme I (PtsI)